MMPNNATWQESTEPFRWWIADGLWDPTDLSNVRDEAISLAMARPDAWHQFRNDRELKDAMTFSTATADGRCPAIAAHRDVLASVTFREWLSGVTGIADLLFDELGGGLHHIPPGGFLDMHADFNRGPSGEYRRLNVLTYLNHGWAPSDGGHLLLGGTSDEPDVTIPPSFNRTVIFETSSTSWHGHPHPTTRDRLSVAAYYFTTTPPPGVDPDAAHSTIFPEAPRAR